MTNPFRRRSAVDLSPPAKVAAFLLLLGWAAVVLFPIYWLVVTSLKTPYDVDTGPFYVPFVDFQPTLDAWRYILVELGNDTLRPYVNTVIVGLSSAAIALFLGSFTAYALVRFTYRPKLGLIGVAIGCIALVFVAYAYIWRKGGFDWAHEEVTPVDEPADVPVVAEAEPDEVAHAD